MADVKHKATTLKKKAMLEALVKCFGNVTTAAELIKIDRCTHYRWLKDDDDYKHQIETMQFGDAICDLAEDALVDKIKKGDTTAIIFTLKTKGKHRGWIESGGYIPPSDVPRGFIWEQIDE